MHVRAQHVGVQMLEHFATRDKKRIAEAIKKYSDVDLEVDV